MADIQFQLKAAPPRVGRTALARQRLEHRWAEINDRTAIIVTAPQGFGKTTLLAQWRRNWLERGAFVARASLAAASWHALAAVADRAGLATTIDKQQRGFQ